MSTNASYIATILTIECDVNLQSQIESYLGSFRYNVVPFQSGQQALDMKPNLNPDLVLMALDDSHYNGFDMLKAMIARAPKTPIIVTSSSEDVDEVVEALHHGAWHYLKKPLTDLWVVKHAVEQTLERAHLLNLKAHYQNHLITEIQHRSDELSSLIDHLPVGLFRSGITLSGHFKMANPALVKMLGYPSVEALEKANINQFITDPSSLQHILDSITTTGQVNQHEVQITQLNGEQFWAAITARLVNEHLPEEAHIDGTIEDISKRKEAEETLSYQAFHDTLTNLPNRELLTERLEQQMISARRQNHYSALLFFDIDNFKNINDALGYSTGDTILKILADRIVDQVRENDTVARLSGDDFVVMLPKLQTSLEAAGFHAKHVAENIKRIIAEPITLSEHIHLLTASVGVVMFPGIGETATDLLQYADTALYAAKDSGKDSIQFFQPRMQEAVRNRLKIETELHNALDEQRFMLHYQPQLDNKGRCIGAESLVRLKNAQGGIISPAEFIPIIEESGLIHPVGLWILEASFKCLLSNPSLEHISINISVRQFYQPHFVETLKDMIHRYQVPVEKITLEITESMLLHNIDDAIRNMNELRDLGIRFAIDDFGTGYSCLSYLKKLPIDELKIDQSFVNDMTEDAAIVETIMSMATHFNLSVVAEGVETIEQRNLLNDMGCPIFQGYYFSRPLPDDMFKAFLTENE